MFSSQVIEDVEKEFREIVGATEERQVGLVLQPDHIIIGNRIAIDERSVNDQIVAFLKKYSFIKFDNWASYVFAVDHANRIANIGVSNYSGYDEVAEQCLWARECRVDDIGAWKRVCIIGDITVDQIHEMSDVLFYLDMAPERRILGLGDIQISDIERIRRLLSFENKSIGTFINEFYAKRDRNHFIDQLIEAGYEDWI